MKSLTDQALISAYERAVDLQLEKEFIEMLLSEIRLRELSMNQEEHVRIIKCAALPPPVSSSLVDTASCRAGTCQ